MHVASEATSVLLSGGKPQLLRRFLSEIIESVTLDGKRVVIRAKEEGFTELVTKFLGSGKEWQPIRGVSYNRLLIFEYRDKPLPYNVLRFNPVQIGEWLDDLLVREVVPNHTALAEYVGMSRTRVGQFLALAELPAGTSGTQAAAKTAGHVLG
jgi:hypothetical protein